MKHNKEIAQFPEIQVVFALDRNIPCESQSVLARYLSEIPENFIGTIPMFGQPGVDGARPGQLSWQLRASMRLSQLAGVHVRRRARPPCRVRPDALITEGQAHVARRQPRCTRLAGTRSDRLPEERRWMIWYRRSGPGDRAMAAIAGQGQPAVALGLRYLGSVVM